MAIGHYSPTKQATSLQEAGANSHLTRSLDQGRVSILYQASEAIYDHYIIFAMHLEFVYQHRLNENANPNLLDKIYQTCVFTHKTLKIYKIQYLEKLNTILPSYAVLYEPYIYEYFIH